MRAMIDDSEGQGPQHAGLEWTGERMVPEKSGANVFWEHVYRYRFATRFIRGRRVLDVACGEGYGAHAMLRAGARSVLGVDISEEACAHARRKYGVDARCGDATCLPVPDHSIDVVVSFETIEHLAAPAAFLEECMRVLTPTGLLVISTPNTKVYSERGCHNSFHCSEMDEEQFVSLLGARFARITLFSQRLKTAAWWSPRSFSALHSPWQNVKGYWRLHRVLSPKHRWETVDTACRQNPSEVILARERALYQFANPYAVRRRAPLTREEPYYLIATAYGPLTPLPSNE